MAGPSSRLLPLEPRLLASQELSNLDIARQSQLYAHLDHPKHAAKLTCLDAKNAQVLSNGNGLHLFLHRAKPIVYVHLVGRVVGIEEKEKRIIWLIDDGTDVIAVHHAYKDQPTATTIQDQSRMIPRASLKGKEKARDVYQYNIPSQYQLPPLPAAPRASRRVSKISSPAIDPVKAFEIGDLLSVVGRIEVWRWGGERIICVDQIKSEEVREEVRSNLERNSTISLMHDPNEEPRHLLQALELSATDYSKPFRLRDATSFQAPTWSGPQKLKELVDNATIQPKPLQKAAALRIMEDEPSAKSQRKALRVMEDINDDNEKPLRSKTLAMPLQSIQNAGEKKSIDTKMRIKSNQERPRPSPDITIIPDQSLPTSQLSITSIQTTGSPRHRRQLRKYTKLSDSNLTESTFRVYVEKHIVDFCSGEISSGGLSHILRTPTSAKKRRSRSSSATTGPPAFTLKYLMMVDDLHGHARRTVEVANKKREEKRRRKAALSKSPVAPIASRERIKDKIKRLYGSVMQAMMMDGIIVLASPSIAIQPPFDGKMRSNADVIVLSSSDTERESFHRYDRQRDLDIYQVVTFTLLAMPIYQIISNTSNANLNCAQILRKLQMMDERWRYIREESVQECIPLLQAAVAQREE